MNNLEKISYEIMKFMRGKYCLDEIGDGKDELKFKQGKRTILTIYTREDRFTFLIIFGKQGREVDVYRCYNLRAAGRSKKADSDQEKTKSQAILKG